MTKDSINNLNPALKAEIKGLRNSIQATAEQQELPKRFEAMPIQGQPAMTILDKETGRSVRVPLFGYGEVRRTLAELFPDNAPGN